MIRKVTSYSQPRARGDQHLTIGLPAILTRYEQAADLDSLKRIVVDREGMAAEFLSHLSREGRTLVTVLRTDQYAELESFRQMRFIASSTITKWRWNGKASSTGF